MKHNTDRIRVSHAGNLPRIEAELAVVQKQIAALMRLSGQDAKDE